MAREQTSPRLAGRTEGSYFGGRSPDFGGPAAIWPRRQQLGRTQPARGLNRLQVNRG